MRLFRIKGGVHPAERKDATREKPVVEAPLAPRLVLPLQQHIGAPAKPLVKPGDQVLKGQPIAAAAGPVSAAIHASTSGTIESIGPQPVPHPSGLPAPAIVLIPDGRDQWCEPLLSLGPYAAPEAIAARVAEAGIVGLGGATFPSAVKLNLRERHRLDTLVMNGAECEPFLTCDDRLMRERSAELIQGVALMARALGVSRAIVAIERNKPEATAAMTNAAAAYREISIAPMPTRYPMGSEKHLVQALTGRETPAKALTADIGVVVHNIATAFAVYEAVILGRPLVARTLTVSGGAIARPMNLKVALGTPIRHLIDFCGGLVEEPQELLAGGPMMGQPLRSTEIPTVKGMNGVLALLPADTRRGPAHACLRCGTCVSACPCGLLPFEMAAHVRNGDFAAALDAGLMDCIGCGSCAFACPSRIPLVQSFHHAKGHVAAEARLKQRADEAKRLAHAKAEREARLAAERKAEMARKKAAAARARAEAGEA